MMCPSDRNICSFRPPSPPELPPLPYYPQSPPPSPLSPPLPLLPPPSPPPSGLPLQPPLTPSPILGNAILYITGKSCASQIENYGKDNGLNVCATLAISCVSKVIMYSEVYDYAWGCRCCDIVDGGQSNNFWSLYTII
jgi:hypothetical protein